MLDTSQRKTILDQARAALAAADRLQHCTRLSIEKMVSRSGKVQPELLEQDQFAAHGFAWQTTYVEALRQTLDWATRLNETNELGDVEIAILRLGFAEYLAQLSGGIPMSQTEIVRPTDMGVSPDDANIFRGDPAVAILMDSRTTESERRTLAFAAAEGRFGALALEDSILEATRAEFIRFGAAKIAPNAQQWHSQDELIPIALVEELAQMGVFGLTIPEEFGGLGLGKTAMCVVSEALSGAYLGVGSLGTRSEIAAEVIRLGGTPEQKQRWLPSIAAGSTLPTAVFTEPNTGSDLGSLRTRAVREGDNYRIYGAKTW
ncbi:MAG: acyl-CoA dehydrogenase family protein, partial [Bradyrhizobium sp.]